MTCSGALFLILYSKLGKVIFQLIWRKYVDEYFPLEKWLKYRRTQDNKLENVQFTQQYTYNLLIWLSHLAKMLNPCKPRLRFLVSVF